MRGRHLSPSSLRSGGRHAPCRARGLAAVLNGLLNHCATTSDDRGYVPDPVIGRNGPVARDDARLQVSKQHGFAFSRRDSPEVCPKSFTPQKSEGAGNAGCALHPRSRVQNGKRKRTRAYRFSGGTPTFPAQWFYGLLRDLPGDQDLFVTVAPRMMAEPTPGWAGFASAGLDANHEASGPHDFAVQQQHQFVSAPLIAHTAITND